MRGALPAVILWPILSAGVASDGTLPVAPAYHDPTPWWVVSESAVAARSAGELREAVNNHIRRTALTGAKTSVLAPIPGQPPNRARRTTMHARTQAIGKTPADSEARDRADGLRRHTVRERTIQPSDCAGWNTREFFRKATAADVNRCLVRGYEVDARDAHDNTPLHWAAQVSGDPDVVRALLDAASRVGRARPTRPLRHRHRSLDLARPYLLRRALVRARNDDARSAAQLAVEHNKNADVLAALLEGGADPQTRTGGGSTLLHLAAHTMSNAKLINVLLSGGVDPAAVDDRGRTAAHVAAAHGTKSPAFKALIAAEQVPRIFDTTPLRDRNRIFYNGGNDLLGTEEPPEQYSYYFCAYPEEFPDVPLGGWCEGNDVLFEGRDAIVLEAQIVGDVNLGGQNGVRALASALERGHRNTGLHWTWQSYATMMVRLRMMNARSRPILPPSFMPKVNVQFIGFKKNLANRDASMHVAHFVVGHHSNGQSGCAFLGQSRDAADECVYAYPRASTAGSQGHVNFGSGNFSTHYLGGRWHYRRTALRSDLGVDWEYGVGVGYELHLPCVAGALCALEDLYGRNRMSGEIGFESEGFEAGLRVMRIFGPRDSERPRVAETWWFELMGIMYVSGRQGVYARAYRGQDPYNIRFADPTSRLEVGFQFSWEDRRSRGGAGRWGPVVRR